MRALRAGTATMRMAMIKRQQQPIVTLASNFGRSKKTLQKPLKLNMENFCTAAKEEEKVEESGSVIGARFATTAEVVVSKIFPAGFGWQGASVVADGWGFAADSIPFALTTGLGDGTGVIVGHTAFYAVKKAVSDPSIEMGAQVQTGIWLGTGAFCAGTSWQPIVNFLHDTMHLSFNQTFAGTFVGCGTMFLVGLRIGRMIYPSMGLSAIPAGDGANLAADAALSVSIGGATACFVGTDVSFVASGVEQNWLRPVVGIEDGMSDLAGMATAGTSTGLGFTVVQAVQNAAIPKGSSASWVGE